MTGYLLPGASRVPYDPDAYPIDPADARKALRQMAIRAAGLPDRNAVVADIARMLGVIEEDNRDAACGTPLGYRRHHQRLEAACDACRAACRTGKARA